MNKQEIISRIRANFPAELQELDQWVVWRIEGRDGKPTKIPYNAQTGGRADSTAPTTWTDFEQAAHAYLNGNYNGVGFVFSSHDPYAGVDFDKCIQAGVTRADRAEQINALASYSETSQSGTGIHTIVRGVIPGERRKSIQHNIEMYDSGRFFVVTGDILPDCPKTVNSRQQQLKDLYAAIFPSTTGQRQPEPARPVNVDDRALLDLMFSSRNGGAIQALWSGDKNGHHNDDSSADLALCNHLAFWTGNDAERMDRLFRQSELFRDKWERKDYRERTIGKAISATTEVYTPRVHTNGNHKQTAEDAPDWAAAPPVGDEPTDGKKKQPTEASKNPKTEEYIRALTELGYEFRLNELDDTLEVSGVILNTGLEAEIRSRMRDIGYERSKAMEDAYTAHAYHSRYHPIRQYLTSLRWDGEDHIFTLATHFDDRGVKIAYDAGERGVFLALFRRWAIGAVAKAFAVAQNPMLVLTGAQGKGKSYFAKWLCSSTPRHHIEESVKPDSNEHNRFLAKKWIWEVGELGATTKRQDIEALKQFLTRVDCDFRTPYARNPIHKPALASFVGTVNPSAGFLVDPTGNRRYMVVDLADIDWNYTKNVNVDQVWAQAYHLWKSGESSSLTDEEKLHQTASNEQHTIEDPYEGWVRRLFNIEPDREDCSLTTSQITATLQDKGVRGETRAIQMRLAETLRGIGLRQHANDRPRRWLGISLKFEGSQ